MTTAQFHPRPCEAIKCASVKKGGQEPVYSNGHAQRVLRTAARYLGLTASAH